MSGCAYPYRGGAYPYAANVSRLVVGPEDEPITLAEAKLAAGLDWTSPDAARDAQMEGFIRAARERVERDTGYALLTQTRDVYLSRLINPIDFPAPARPLQSIEQITGVDADGGAQILAPASWSYSASGRLTLTQPADWTLYATDVHPWIVRIIVGWETATEIPPLLLFAVKLLTAHYATAARDAVVIGTSAIETPLGYEDAIGDFRRVAV
jgi:uncharacterized phiE125 gp8 family phage protein